VIELPDPPLVWPPPDQPGREAQQEPRASHPGWRGLAPPLGLRAWRADDAPALVAAWADPEIRRWTAVPERGDLAAAEWWIAGDEARRRRELSLDLVVERDGEVVGEVGLSSIDRAAGTVEIGWWTAADHRRRGIASAAATLLAGWARGVLGLTCIARCDPANPGSVAVAERAGAMVLL
jgi:RimJ/RimL family protein N-acetyltransferase